MIIQGASRGKKDNPSFANEFINDHEILNAENVVTLLVSATPYNILTKTSRVGVDQGGEELNVIRWWSKDQTQEEYLEVNPNEMEYVSVEKYIDTMGDDKTETQRIKPDEFMSRVMRVIRHLTKKMDQSMPDVHLVINYMLCLLVKPYLGKEGDAQHISEQISTIVDKTSGYLSMNQFEEAILTHLQYIWLYANGSSSFAKKFMPLEMEKEKKQDEIPIEIPRELFKSRVQRLLRDLLPKPQIWTGLLSFQGLS